MDPITLTYFAMSGLQLYNGLNQAELTNTSAEIQKQISDLNAEFADIDAFDAEKKGMTEAARYSGVIENTISAQKAILAFEGVDTSYGTAKTLEQETRLTGFLNIQDIKNNASATALGFKRQASDYRLQGLMSKLKGSSDASAIRSSALLNAGSTALTGYSKMRKPAAEPEV